ncbi:hypothetical protein BC834DRAFT_131850 [Gloeopeniophorella convolvens]|nr:hypothetical protein BC834DRAFT_131850 [Gloeopeniophorella convolvens]
MMDVFRANPFTAMGLPRNTNPRGPPLQSPTDSSHIPAPPELQRRSTKRPLSPEVVGQKRKARAKRARTQPPFVIPFPATGPQEMFAHEFKIDIPCRSPDAPRAGADYQGKTHFQPCHSPNPVNANEHPSALPIVSAPDVQDVVMGYPEEHESVALSHWSHIPHSFTSIPILASPQPCPLEAAQRPQHVRHFFLPVPLPVQAMPRWHNMMSTPAGSVTQVGAAGCRVPIDEHGYYTTDATQQSSILSVRVVHPRARNSSSAASGKPKSKTLYPCPLCPRDFQLPNGLALHLKWHDRVDNPTQDPSPYRTLVFNAPPASDPEAQPFQSEPGPPCPRGLLPVELPEPNRDHGDQIPSPPPSALFVSNPVRFDCVASGAFPGSHVNPGSYGQQPREQTFVANTLQLNYHASFSSFDGHLCLAPLDGFPVLQPLPFEQHISATGVQCIVPPS